MKITCDLCGGTLQMNMGGQTATCTGCGMAHPMQRLREKLYGSNHILRESDTPVPMQEHEVKQFVMPVTNAGIGDVSGHIQQGGIGLGDRVYINHDYSHPYRVYSLCDLPDLTSVKEGMYADLFLVKCPKKILKSAQVVTGDPDPVANAYNFPGTVREYFSGLLLRQFPEYEIHGDMIRDDLKIPVSYMLCRDGRPVLALFLIDSNDSKARYQVKKAARIFAPEGISCIHFFENYRNDTPYVIDRVRGALA